MAVHVDRSLRLPQSEYFAELRKPRITWGRSIGLIAALGAGFVIGRVVHE
jgi:hypothetical protein